MDGSHTGAWTPCMLVSLAQVLKMPGITLPFSSRVVRLLVYVILLLSGFPTKVLTAYINYQEQAYIYFSFAGHIGSPHRHLCGIPQGCPFSMMIIALLLRPWHLLARAAHVIPRALADDLLLLASGAY
eukprot:8318355-Karenia_brevis.AAC.1